MFGASDVRRILFQPFSLSAFQPFSLSAFQPFSLSAFDMARPMQPADPLRMLVLDTAAHTAAFMRMASTSKKTLPELWTEEARICFGGSGKMPGVAGITPPYDGKTSVGQAGKKGRAKVAADIYNLYGTPDDAYDAIAEKSPGEAQAFWWLKNHGDVPGAAQVLRDATGSTMAPFDDGVHHRRNFRKKRRRFLYYVTDPKNLKAYVQLEQEQVWWLVGGWEDGLTALGAHLPAGVKKQDSPGHLDVSFTDQQLKITIGNDVKYGPQIADMKRRIETVMNEWRVARLDRMWDKYLESLARTSGFKKKS